MWGGALRGEISLDGVKKSYKPGIKAPIDLWIERLEDGVILGLVPVLGIIQRIRMGGGTRPPCGSGAEAYAILPNGNILACPIAFDVEWAKIGSIYSCSPSGLPKFSLNSSCQNCNYFAICGGRCLYVNREVLWDRNHMEAVCDVTKFTILELENVIVKVEKALKSSIISHEMLEYPKFNNSTEIIP